jgi:LCP family protein required for cell wall assembly
MSEFPEGWFRGGQGGDRHGTDDANFGIPAGQRPAAPPGGWPDQPPPSTRGGLGTPSRSPVRYPGGPGGPNYYGGPRRRRWPRRILTALALVVVLVVIGTVATYFYLNSKLTHSDILAAYPGRPAVGSGTNWLIAGSDSRQGLTSAQEHQYSTGNLDATGEGRSDTIMILHIPAGGGRPILISVPRDSYVNIPGYGMNKINAAFSFGGPALLAKTIQSDTGLYINHFMDIGFGGFVNVVNAVGGVRMCLPSAINDQASGLNLSAGCQVLSGGQALAWVRDRHSFATQDLQREQDQRLFLSALLKKMTSAGVILNPFDSVPAASGVASNLTVDQATQLYQLLSAARALQNPLTTTVPIASSNYSTSVGDAVLWNSTEATQLFTALQSGQPVPANLITGSTLG